MLLTPEFTLVRRRRYAAEGAEYRMVPDTDSRYRVGSDGTFWSLKKDGSWKQLKTTFVPAGKGGTTVVSIVVDGKYVSKNISHLILESFGKPRPPHSQPGYIDGDSRNVRLDNLKWVDRNIHQVGVPMNFSKEDFWVKGEEHGQAVLTDEGVANARRLYLEGWNINELARKYGVNKTSMKYALTGVHWKHVPNPVTLRKHRQRDLSPKLDTSLSQNDIDEVEYLHAEGKTPEEIAELTGVRLDRVRALIPVGNRNLGLS